MVSGPWPKIQCESLHLRRNLYWSHTFFLLLSLSHHQKNKAKKIFCNPGSVNGLLLYFRLFIPGNCGKKYSILGLYFYSNNGDVRILFYRKKNKSKSKTMIFLISAIQPKWKKNNAQSWIMKQRDDDILFWFFRSKRINKDDFYFNTKTFFSDIL